MKVAGTGCMSSIQDEVTHCGKTNRLCLLFAGPIRVCSVLDVNPQVMTSAKDSGRFNEGSKQARNAKVVQAAAW